jgi:hypothetical protein
MSKEPAAQNASGDDFTKKAHRKGKNEKAQHWQSSKANGSGNDHGNGAFSKSNGNGSSAQRSGDGASAYARVESMLPIGSWQRVAAGVAAAAGGGLLAVATLGIGPAALAGTAGYLAYRGMTERDPKKDPMVRNRHED